MADAVHDDHDGHDEPEFTPRRRRSRASRRRSSFLRELPVLLLVALLLAFLLRTFVLQVFYIPSSSMAPTLQVDDRMVVEKLTYRFREPARGEVVVFEGDGPGQAAPQMGAVTRLVRGVGQFLGVVPASARDFVKRVIGEPGDEILIESGRVSVNGRPLDEPYVVHGDESDYGPVTVPEGHLFFLGDNRPNSSDSRRSLGFVAIDHVVGRSVTIIWPPSHVGMLTGTRYPSVAGGAAPPVTADAGTAAGPQSSAATSPSRPDVGCRHGANGDHDRRCSPQGPWLEMDARWAGVG